MNIEKSFWKEISLQKDRIPEIVCPVCNRGHLKLIKESFHYKETVESKRNQQHPEWEPEWVEYRFSVSFKCNYENCNDITVCIGTGGEEPNYEYDEDSNQMHQVWTSFFTPIYFIPCLKIIPISDKYPKTIQSVLNDSFSHFFSDLPSCGNKIRVCIEILMTELGIKKTVLQKGKRKPYPLHARIIEYKVRNPEVADYLLAIKWIGNTGSHLDQLTKDDILNAYDLLDHSLKKIYDTKEKELRKLSREINKRKAPLSKKRILKRPRF